VPIKNESSPQRVILGSKFLDHELALADLTLWLLPKMILSVPTETECQMSPKPLLVEVPEENEGETSMRRSENRFGRRSRHRN
jgi:hypothetical protein